MVLGPGDKEIEEDKIKNLEGTSMMRLARPKDVERVVGCKIGCVPPFGHKRKIKTYLNKELLGYDYLYFNPGNHSKTIKIKAKDLPKLVEDPIMYE
jgi:prolyl-tRNA editing enzyme YbaK/EbsC (Cys-tRNA(Pro) deacylase)